MIGLLDKMFTALVIKTMNRRMTSLLNTDKYRYVLYARCTPLYWEFIDDAFAVKPWYLVLTTDNKWSHICSTMKDTIKCKMGYWG